MEEDQSKWRPRSSVTDVGVLALAFWGGAAVLFLEKFWRDEIHSEIL